MIFNYLEDLVLIFVKIGDVNFNKTLHTLLFHFTPLEQKIKVELVQSIAFNQLALKVTMALLLCLSLVNSSPYVVFIKNEIVNMLFTLLIHVVLSTMPP